MFILQEVGHQKNIDGNDYNKYSKGKIYNIPIVVVVQNMFK